MWKLNKWSNNAILATNTKHLFGLPRSYRKHWLKKKLSTFTLAIFFEHSVARAWCFYSRKIYTYFPLYKQWRIQGESEVTLHPIFSRILLPPYWMIGTANNKQRLDKRFHQNILGEKALYHLPLLLRSFRLSCPLYPPTCRQNPAGGGGGGNRAVYTSLGRLSASPRPIYEWPLPSQSYGPKAVYVTAYWFTL